MGCGPPRQSDIHTLRKFHLAACRICRAQGPARFVESGVVPNEARGEKDQVRVQQEQWISPRERATAALADETAATVTRQGRGA